MQVELLPSATTFSEQPKVVLSSAKSFRFSEPAQPRTKVVEAPLSLTASDGTVFLHRRQDPTTAKATSSSNSARS